MESKSFVKNSRIYFLYIQRNASEVISEQLDDSRSHTRKGTILEHHRAMFLSK